ncbi:MAG: NADH:ubiquinone oxidoreductase, partial [Elusimicrobia bacterium]|nr:NADH:ubiquinone oxidoreductase [Elusimicrobiota bacterium]
KPCAQGCAECRDVCPTKAISLDPVRLDLGRCIFCNECALACPEKKIEFTPETRMGAATPEGLMVLPGRAAPTPVATSAALKKLFGRSLKLRQVSAGGCNGCELELNALANVNFDLQRYGIEWVASPRHADGLVLSGPLTQNMADALQLAWDAMPEPRFVVAFGACAISGGPFRESPVLDRSFLDRFQPALFIPGCPPHPLTFIAAILDLLGVE